MIEFLCVLNIFINDFAFDTEIQIGTEFLYNYHDSSPMGAFCSQSSCMKL